MPERNRWAALVLLTFGIATGTGCTEVFDPCPETEETEFLGQMDGAWDLIEINGSPIPAGGYSPVPFTKRLTGGTLHFETLTSNKTNNCDNLTKTEGNVIVIYTMVNANGSARAPDWHIGGFEMKHNRGDPITDAEGSVMLRGGGYTAVGDVTVEVFAGRYLEVQLRSEDFGFGDIGTFTLTFAQVTFPGAS